jgi:glucokinase
VDGRVLIDAARAGDAGARAALAEPIAALGTVLAGAVALMGAEAVILAGGVAGAADVLAPLIEARLRAHLPPHLRAVSIRAGRFGPQAGLVGAAIAGRLGAGWRDAP